MSNLKTYSFEKGYDKIAGGQQNSFRSDVMEALNLTTTQAFYIRMRGEVIPKVTEVEIIERLMLKYGVKKSNIWGGRQS